MSGSSRAWWAACRKHSPRVSTISASCRRSTSTHWCSASVRWPCRRALMMSNAFEYLKNRQKVEDFKSDVVLKPPIPVSQRPVKFFKPKSVQNVDPMETTTAAPLHDGVVMPDGIEDRFEPANE